MYQDTINRVVDAYEAYVKSVDVPSEAHNFTKENESYKLQLNDRRRAKFRKCKRFRCTYVRTAQTGVESALQRRCALCSRVYGGYCHVHKRMDRPPLPFPPIGDPDDDVTAFEDGDEEDDDSLLDLII